MRGIDVAAGITVNLDSINFITRRDDGTALIQGGERVLHSEIPFETIRMMMLRSEEEPAPAQVNSPLIGDKRPVASGDNPFQTDPAW